MRKEYIVRSFDVSYFNHMATIMDEEMFESSLNEEYGKHGFSICATIPQINAEEKVVAYKFIFVKDLEGDEE